MQYDIIMNLDFYVFQNILEHYSKILEERKQAEEDEMKRQGYDPKKYDPDRLMHNTQKNMPKMPTIQMPKISVK